MIAKEGKGWTYAVFAVVVLASALGNLSQTGLNAMLVSVCGELSISTGVGQWLTTSYMFALGAVVPLSPYFMGRFRLKDLAALAITLFIAGALLAVASTSFPMLLFARVVQAIAAGMLLPLLQTIAMTRFPQGSRATAMGIAGVAMGFAPNIGPTIGGAMVGVWGWRSFFVLLTALSLVLLAFLMACVARRDDASYPAGLDVPSFILATAGFGGILMGCSQASSLVFSNPLVWAPLVVGVICLAIFVRRQGRCSMPLIDMGIFKSPIYAAGFAGQCLLCASFMGITLLVPLYVENLRGGTPLEAGMVLLPATVVALVANPLAGYLTDKAGARPVALVSGACLAIGSVSMITCDESMPLWLVMAMQGVRGAGVSGLIGPLTSWSLSGLSGKRVADGSAFGLAARQTAASVGTALMVLCVEGAAALSGAAAYHVAFAVSAIFALATFICIVWKVR